MKIALVQMTASVDNSQQNETLIMGYIDEALKLGVTHICFPEMSMVGYGFEHMTERMIQQDGLMARLQGRSMESGLTIIVGGLEAYEGNTYISQYVIGSSIESYRKIHVGQKERLYVKSGEEIKIFECNGIKVGLMLCYDGHFPELTTIMAELGAELILNPSASPNNPESRLEMWQKYLTARAYDNRVWVAATNLRFKGKGGGMLVIDGDGQEVVSSSVKKDEMMVFDYTPVNYSKTSMKKRDFKVDRRQDIYDKYR